MYLSEDGIKIILQELQDCMSACDGYNPLNAYTPPAEKVKQKCELLKHCEGSQEELRKLLDKLKLLSEHYGNSAAKKAVVELSAHLGQKLQVSNPGT